MSYSQPSRIEDTAIQLSLAEGKGLLPEKARILLLDQRTWKARKTSSKFLVREIALLQG